MTYEEMKANYKFTLKNYPSVSALFENKNIICTTTREMKNGSRWISSSATEEVIIFNLFVFLFTYPSKISADTNVLPLKEISPSKSEFLNGFVVEVRDVLNGLAIFWFRFKPTLFTLAIQFLSYFSEFFTYIG